MFDDEEVGLVVVEVVTRLMNGEVVVDVVLVAVVVVLGAGQAVALVVEVLRVDF